MLALIGTELIVLQKATAAIASKLKKPFAVNFRLLHDGSDRQSD